MQAISYTKARDQLAGLTEHVCQDHDPVIITRQKQSSVVMISLKDYNSLTETAYLLQSSKNASRTNETVTGFITNQNFSKVKI